MNKTILTTILFLSIGLTAFTQINFDKGKLDDYFNALEENNKFMGSVAVTKNGKVIYTKTIGFSDVDNKIKATDNSKYRIGSISKSFTAVLILKAVEENKLDLNQTIDKWFPELKNARDISVKLLLNHRSGIHNFTNDKDYPTWKTQPKTEKEMLEIIAKGGSDFQPDSKAEYSNSNYVLLSYILENIFSKSYSELLQEHIVKPVGLTSTYVFGKINSSDNESKSYSFMETWKIKTETDYTIPLGAGAITSTANDLTKFADALLGGKLLKSESLEIMKTIKDSYGMGLIQVPFFNNIGYGHSGNIDGFSSVYSHFAEDKISYALISNGTNYNINNISIAVLSAVFDKPYDIPEFSTYEVNSDDLDKYLGVYASKQIALKITITKDGNTLIAQGTSQPALPLEATDKDKFKLDQLSVKLEFNPTDETMILFQGGGQIQFAKEETPLTSSQETVMSGLLIDSETNSPIEFANMGVVDKNKGTVSNQEGKFKIMFSREFANDSLTISHVLYKTVKIPIKNSRNLVISLQPNENQLSEVVITNIQKKNRKIGVKSYNPMFSGSTVSKEMDIIESSIKIKIPKNKTVWVKDVNFYLRRGFETDSAFIRINFYKNLDGSPGEKIVFENIIQRKQILNGWVNIDLENNSVYLEEDFFIGVEIIPDFIKHNEIYIGAVLTKGNGFMRKSSLGEWIENPLGLAQSINVEVEY